MIWGMVYDCFTHISYLLVGLVSPVQLWFNLVLVVPNRNLSVKAAVGCATVRWKSRIREKNSCRLPESRSHTAPQGILKATFRTPSQKYRTPPLWKMKGNVPFCEATTSATSISPIRSDSAVILSRYLQIELAMKATLLIVGLPRLKNWVTVSC